MNDEPLASSTAAEVDLEELEREISWLVRLLDLRFRLYFPSGEGEEEPSGVGDLSPPSLSGSGSVWARLVEQHASEPVSRMALVLALVPHLRPSVLDVFFTKNSTFDRRFTEFGGVVLDDRFEPTGETLAFILDGGSPGARLEVARLLEPDHPLLRSGILAIEAREGGPTRAPLRLSHETLGFITTGARPIPSLGIDFPAQRITTSLDWDDLVLHPGTLRLLEEIQTFIAHGRTLMDDWGMAARLRPGHRALFYGRPGVGKTFSVGLLGKATGRDAYRIDLSLVISKYIGETEKNLARVFDRAQDRGWILLFDEADALFGKRGETKDAHDRYANQEVAYLLQRIETFDGIAILASNMRENLDEAFMRRFESVVYFPMPRAQERLRLWTRGFPPRARLDDSVDLDAIARDHELAGGSIMNVIRQVCLVAISEGERVITQEDIVRGIRRELSKEGRGT